MAEAVAQLARGDQGDGEGEQIAVGDPLDVGERGAEVPLDRGFAMATMVPSRATIITPMATAKRVSQGWPRSPLTGAGTALSSGSRGAFSTVV